MSEFPSFEETREMLDEIAEEVPEAFYRELHGGIILIPEEKKHRESKEAGNLYIMGEYHRNAMGRKILIYYGSFKKMYPKAPIHILRKKLKDTLLHEFTHHIESLAGERGLEKKDEEKMHRYRQRRNKN
ncbi:metallopeptidase family protein [Isachenkonia alkalipeptolytica]|uniref:Metallopeptidase family protein n=1 Tax=Isachenkonia alkalipeptolytica TaxID=2565777 RepID=A0AA43XM18_9CLOT|nr:metallopeptidase family protein [Isachenkonia alkalipeptolytica]NBG89303.1 metallopeptidase family protein [Isachenkonia alkalipeptolytica]